MCSGPKAGSYLRVIDFVYLSTLGLRVITKKMGAATSPLSWRRRAQRSASSSLLLYDLKSMRIKYEPSSEPASPPVPLSSEYDTYKTVTALIFRYKGSRG